MRKPLCIDLFCGKFGWSRPWLALGGYVVGFDISHEPYHGPVPEGADLVLQDVRTLRGSQFRHASLILASSPCPEYSYMAMPFGRGRQIARALRGRDVFPEGYRGSQSIEELNFLFYEPQRIQREACEAAGRYIPLVQENVRGAEAWVGRAAYRYGSFYLWGDVPALMPIAEKVTKLGGGASWYHPSDPRHVPGLDFTQLAGRQAAGEKAIRFGTYAERKARGDTLSLTSSGSRARKAASARIAEIPYPLAAHVCRVYYPHAKAGAA